MESVAADVGRGLHHARLYEAENRLVDELRAVDQVKSDFLATVSHELRTPLTSIAGYIEILRDRTAGPLTPAQEQMLDSVDRNTARLRHLIEDVLTLSKIESGAFTSIMRPVSLAEIVAADVTALQPAAAAKGLTLNWQDSDHSLMVSGDSGQLDRLVMNLLSNAVKFTPAGGSVSVGAGCDGELAVLRVSDTGIGIPATRPEGPVHPVLPRVQRGRGVDSGHRAGPGHRPHDRGQPPRRPGRGVAGGQGHHGDRPDPAAGWGRRPGSRRRMCRSPARAGPA